MIIKTKMIFKNLEIPLKTATKASKWSAEPEPEPAAAACHTDSHPVTWFVRVFVWLRVSSSVLVVLLYFLRFTAPGRCRVVSSHRTRIQTSSEPASSEPASADPLTDDTVGLLSSLSDVPPVVPVCAFMNLTTIWIMCKTIRWDKILDFIWGGGATLSADVPT